MSLLTHSLTYADVFLEEETFFLYTLNSDVRIGKWITRNNCLQSKFHNPLMKFNVPYIVEDNTTDTPGHSRK